MKSKAHTIESPSCAFCGVAACEYEPGSHLPPKFCAATNASELLAAAELRYTDQEGLLRLTLAAAQTEASGYMRRTRVEDIMDFAHRIGDKPCMLESDKSEAWDIDEELDFQVTEFLMERRK